jgi:hypothetical protein
VPQAPLDSYSLFLFWVGPFCVITPGPFCVDITNKIRIYR